MQSDLTADLSDLVDQDHPKSNLSIFLNVHAIDLSLGFNTNKNSWRKKCETESSRYYSEFLGLTIVKSGYMVTNSSN